MWFSVSTVIVWWRVMGWEVCVIATVENRLSEMDFCIIMSSGGCFVAFSLNTVTRLNCIFMWNWILPFTVYSSRMRWLHLKPSCQHFLLKYISCFFFKYMKRSQTSDWTIIYLNNILAIGLHQVMTKFSCYEIV